MTIEAVAVGDSLSLNIVAFCTACKLDSTLTFGDISHSALGLNIVWPSAP